MSVIQVSITIDTSLYDSDSDSLILICDASNAIKPSYRWTSSDHLEILDQNTSTIEVTVTPDSIQYNCTVTDSNGDTGFSTVFLDSNGQYEEYKYL